MQETLMAISVGVARVEASLMYAEPTEKWRKKIEVTHQLLQTVSCMDLIQGRMPKGTKLEMGAWQKKINEDGNEKNERNTTGRNEERKKVIWLWNRHAWRFSERLKYVLQRVSESKIDLRVFKGSEEPDRPRNLCLLEEFLNEVGRILSSPGEARRGLSKFEKGFKNLQQVRRGWRF